MRILLMLFFVSGTLHNFAQNKINSYQYWFDGQYNNATSQSITPAATYTLSTQVNTNALLNGLHIFNIKFGDDSSRFSSTLSTFFYKKLPSTSSNTINAYQYWFDNNFTNAVTQNASGSSFTFADNLSTLNLLNGLHVLHIRFKDQINVWSETLSQFFYKSSLTGSPGTITAYQYWYDQNFAGAVQQNLTSGSIYTLSAPLNTATLLPGLHVLNLRFLDNSNKWSSTVSQFFYKATDPGVATITKIQYWFDQSFSAAVQQNLTPGSIYTLSAPLNTATLVPGLHVLNLRFLDNNNKWSSTVSQFFYKTIAPGATNITTFQYWFDQDFAGTVQQSITPSGSVILSEQLSTSALLNGLHAISVRFSDSKGKWSSTLTQFFYKEKTNTVTDNKITGYRYWFDERDSILNLVDIAPFMNPLIINQPIAADGMDSGQHVIHFQFRDVNGKWSMITSDTATVIAKATYTFNGNGNWSNAANWVNKMKPPLTIAGTYKIFIDPVPGGECILDVNQQITEGAIFTVRSGKTFIIPGNLNINQ